MKKNKRDHHNDQQLNPKTFKLIRDFESLSTKIFSEMVGYRYSRVWQLEKGSHDGGVKAGISAARKYSNAFDIPLWEIFYISYCIDNNSFLEPDLSLKSKSYLAYALGRERRKIKS